MTNDRMNLRNERVTQEAFDRLPALLSAYQVKLVTGLDDGALYAAVASGQLAVWQPAVKPGCARSYRKYTKVSVGRMVGYRV